MKITFLNSTDSGGGAANACKRQAEALYESGADIIFLSQKQKAPAMPYSQFYLKNKIDKAFYFGRHLLNERLLKKYPERQPHNFSAAYFGASVEDHPAVRSADIVHLHWINDSFITPASINKLKQQGKKLVWTLHDMWAFTGGCHYSGNCEKYTQHCGKCPVLKSNVEEDLSFQQLVNKAAILKGMGIHIITPSHWLAKCARESTLFGECPVSVIRYALNTGVYKPLDKESIRRKFDIGPDKKLILFGAVNAVHDTRKGFKYLVEALKILYSKNMAYAQDIELAVFGSKDDNSLSLPFKTHFLGNFSTDESLAEVYNLADVFAIPSLEDNLPNTVMESMACGVPAVGFRIGGIPDMIEHLQTGYTAEPLSPESLAEGFVWILENEERYKSIAAAARTRAVTEYAYPDIAEQHIRLYESL